MEFRPVLTAHPTEARRRAVSASIRRIAELVAERDSRSVGGMSLAENDRRLLGEIDTLWRTAPLREAKPTVLDEVRTVLSVFESTLADTLPDVYRRLDDWLLADAAGTTAPAVRAFARLGSWIGGDRDGNPNVTAEITLQAAQMSSDKVLSELEASARRTAGGLTLSGDDTPASAELAALWAEPGRARPRRWPTGSPSTPRTSRTAGSSTSSPSASRRPGRSDALPRVPGRRRARVRPGRRAALAGRGRRHAVRVRRAAAADLAGADLRVPPGRARGPAALAGPRGRARGHREERPRRRAGAPHGRGARHVPRARRGAAPVRPRGGPPLHRLVHAVAPSTSRPSTSWPSSRSQGVGLHADHRRDPAVRDLRGPRGERRHPRGARSRSRRSSAGSRRTAAGSRSCSATRTRRRTSARSRRRSPSTRRSAGSPSGRAATTSS